MANLKHWVVQTRTHTAALTIAGTLLAVRLAAPATPWHLYLLFAIEAWLMHAAGFLVNALLDLPWDRVDPAKAHHPIVAGHIRERDAWAAVVVGTTLFTALGAYLAHDHPWSLLALVGFAAFGTLYNHQCKVSLGGPIWISLSFACIPLYAWLAVGPPTMTMWYVAVYALLLMEGQIAISGWVKDLGRTGEVNLLRRWGSTVHEYPGEVEYYFPYSVLAFAALLRGGLASLACWWVPAHGSPTTWAITVALGLLALHSIMRVVSNGTRPKKSSLRDMGVAEIIAYWLLIASLATQLGWPWTLGFVVGPVVYYVATNRVFWGKGHALGPAV